MAGLDDGVWAPGSGAPTDDLLEWVDDEREEDCCAGEDE